MPASVYLQGLAYMRLVRSNRQYPTNVVWPMLPALLHNPVGEVTESQFRGAASQRVLETWSYYLTTPEFKKDSSGPTIATVVKVLKDAETRATAAEGGRGA